MADTAALVVALSAQLTKFEKDMKEAAQIAARGAKNIEDSFAKTDLGATFDKIIKGGIIGLVIREILQAATAVKDLIESVDKIGDAAEVVGVTAQQFQELTFAIVASGQSAEKAEQFMDRFARSLSEAQNNSGELFKIFQANKIDPTGLGTQEALFKFADLIRNAKTQQDALNLAMTVGGRQAGPSLVLALQQGGDGLKRMAEEGRKLGTVLDEDVTGKADEITRAYDVMALTVTRFFQKHAVSLGAKIKEVIDEIKGIESEAGKQRTQFVTVTGGGKETDLPDPTVEKFQKLIDAQQKRVELLQAEQATIGQSVGAQAQYRTQIELEAQAKAQEIALTPERIAAIQREAAAVGAATDELAKQKFAFNELQSSSQELGSALSQAFQGAIIEGKKFDEVLNNLVRRLESKAFDKLFDLAFAPQGAGTSSLFAQLLSSLGKAGGGPVSGGQPYVVGEKGPELFIPKSSGMIVPNRVMGASGTRPADRNLNVSVDVTGANGDAAIEAAVNRGVQRAVQQSVSIVNANAPARNQRYAQLGT